MFVRETESLCCLYMRNYVSSVCVCVWKWRQRTMCTSQSWKWSSCLSHTTESPLFFDSLHFNCFLTIPKHCYSFSYTYFSSCQLNFHLLPFNLSNHVPPTPLVNNTRITYPFAIKVGWCFDFSFSVSCLS